MGPSKKRARYLHHPIRDLTSLANLLEVSPGKLLHLSGRANELYVPKIRHKRSGEAQQAWNARVELKAVHNLLKHRVLGKVQFPTYLQGGIRDRAHPRDYARNATMHVGASCIVSFDIENFFPSVTTETVEGIWKEFFGFGDAPARVLTALTTKDGALPIGAKTSNHLANLVFHKSEHELVSYLSSQGWRYSRLNDDINISSVAPQDSRAISSATRTVIGFVNRHGLKIRRPKYRIQYSHRPMIVNQLVVNRRTSLTRQKRSEMRSYIYHRLVEANGQKRMAYLSVEVSGKLCHLCRFHPIVARRMRDAFL